MKFNPKLIQKIIKHYKHEKSNLLAILTDIQGEYNWLPPQALKLISEQLDVPLIDIYGVASFYHAFSLAPRGKHIVTVCQGTACHVRGAPTILDRFQNKLGIAPGCTTKDDQFTLETVNCLGACALAPIVVVDGNYHGQTTPQKVDAVVLKYRKKRIPKKKKSKPKKKKTSKKSRRKSRNQRNRKKITIKKSKKKVKKTSTIKKQRHSKPNRQRKKKMKTTRKIKKRTAEKVIVKKFKKKAKRSAKKKTSKISKKRK